MSATDRVRVFITVDTEFSIGGAFDDPINNEPVGTRAVELPSSNSSEGLGFLLDTLRRHSLAATFFVETCNAAFFGPEPMTRIIQTINAARHDVQLHLHPCWSTFSDPKWPKTIETRKPVDSLADYPVADIARFINEGAQIIKNAGAPAPIALRAGNLQGGRNVVEAMEQAEIPVGSNIGLAVDVPAEPAHRRYGGCIALPSGRELPVLSYKEMNLGRFFRNKTLTVIGSTFAELKYVLRMAHRNRLQYVVILTHPSEFAKYTRPSITDITANRKTQGRFEQLCAFLSDNADQYDVTTFSSSYSAGLEACEDPILQVPLRFTAQRLLSRLFPV
jgi:hypothetical protein